MAKGLTGGQVIAKMLAAEGVTDMFGIIDGTYFGLYRALEDSGIELHSPRHEAAAMHMAGAYARLTGRLGVRDGLQRPGCRQCAARVSQWSRARAIASCSSPSSRRVADRLPRPGRHVPVLRPGRGDGADDEVQRARAVCRPHPRTAAQGAAGQLQRPPGRGPHRHPREHHQPADRARRQRAAGTAELPARRLRCSPTPVLVERAARLLVDAQQPVIHVGSGVYHAGAEAGTGSAGESAGSTGDDVVGRPRCAARRTGPRPCR